MKKKMPVRAKQHAESSTPWLNYQAGGRDEGGVGIRTIIHRTDRGIIYITEKDNIFWHVNDQTNASWKQATAESYNLLTQLKLTVNDQAVRGRALRMIGSALARALETGDSVADAADILKDAREFVGARTRETLCIQYLAAAALTAILLPTSFALAAEFLSGRPESPFFRAAALGGAGAMLSVIQRFRTIPIERYTARYFTRIEGCTRIVLGSAFGIVFQMFHQAGVVLTVGAEQPYLLAAASFVAGFSERLIPDLLNGFERHAAGASALA